MFGAYMNRYLEVNLTEQTFSSGDVDPELQRTYIGGKGLGLRLLLGLLVSSVGTMNMNRWVREPRADQAVRQAEQLARTARHVQLSEDPNFQAEFAEAMIFPDSLS